MEGKELCRILLEEAEKGNICFFDVPDHLVTVNLETFLRQPAEGIVYDLNRDYATALTFISQGDMTWVNNFAAALVIKTLYQKIETR